MPNPILYTYPNGLRVIYEKPKHNTGQSIIRAFVHVGSVMEPADIRGASHFIEHMCFKGTRSLHSYHAVNEPFSHSGSYFNATTTKQYTCYKVDCLDSHLTEFLPIVGDMLFHSTFDRAEYKKELNVVREEVKMRTPDSYIDNLAFNGTPYAEWVDHVSFHTPGCLPYDKVLQYYHLHYTPQNMVLSVVSSIPFEKIRACVAKSAFMEKGVSSQPIFNSPACNVINPTNDSLFSVKSNDQATSYIELAVRVCSQFAESECHILNVLKQIMGGTMSSRLFVELRDKRGLTYNSYARVDTYEPAGVFVICAKTDTERLLRDGKSPGVLPVMLAMIDSLIKRGVKESEVRWAKQRIRELGVMTESELSEKCEYNGERVLLHNDAEVIANAKLYDTFYKNITKADVNAIIQKYFAPRVYFLSIIGGKLPRKSEIAKLMERASS